MGELSVLRQTEFTLLQPTWQPVNKLKAGIYHCVLCKLASNLSACLQRHSYIHGPQGDKTKHRGPMSVRERLTAGEKLIQITRHSSSVTLKFPLQEKSSSGRQTNYHQALRNWLTVIPKSVKHEFYDSLEACW